ncbi:MAG: alpha-L-rhamnosidase N-terminal domain-containing protein [Fibrobacterota bacterium]
MRNIILSSAFLMFITLSQAASPDAPIRLRVIDSYEQLGIDRSAPRFGWMTTDADRGESQSAYQLIVASSQSNINANTGDMWSSGWVNSSAPTNITYHGTALSSCAQYWYKVQTKDKDGNTSAWSAAASFSTGFLSPSDWDAGTAWIQSDFPDSEVAKCPLFRREFTVSKTVRRATITICGLGHYELYINGSRIGDHVLDPLWSEYTKTCYYATYDVTANLSTSDNAIGVILGNGFYNSFSNPRHVYAQTNYGPKKLIAELRIEYTDNSTAKIITDASWKFAKSPITFSSIYGGEDYDARLEQSGWADAGFNDASWKSAIECSGPGGALVSQFAPPVKVRHVLSAVSSSGNNYTFSTNCAAQPEITVNGTAGSVVKIGPTIIGGECYYTLKGGGPETWHPAFYYDFVTSPLTVQVISGSATIQDVKLRYVYSAADSVGSFSCSDVWINKIHQIILEAIRSNLQAVHTDCPHREKLGWLETSGLMGPSIMYNFDVSTLWSKIAKDCRDGQAVGGAVPATVPNYLHMDGDNAWSSSIIICPWLVYRYSGATRAIEDGYTAMKAYDNTLGDGIIGYHWGDWGNPSPYGRESQGPETGISFYDSKILAQAAELLGNTADQAFFSNQTARIAEHYNNVFLNNSGYYGRGPSPTANSHQALQAVALDFDMVPPGKEASVLNQLLWLITARDNGHLGCGEVSLPSLWRALDKYEHNELAYAMIMQPLSPSYYAFVKDPNIRTLPEFFKDGAEPGSCHDMLGHVEEWFYSALAGISPAKPGYEEIRIAPHAVGGMTACSASVMTVRGLVSSRWVKSPGEFDLNVAIPVNSFATVCLPKWSNMTLRESGTAIWQSNAPAGSVAGLAFKDSTGAHVSWTAGSGNYTFVLTGTEPAVTPLAPTPPDTVPFEPLIQYQNYTNVALAVNGATVAASSQILGNYPANGVINGNRTSSDWGQGGGWNDNTYNNWPDWVQITFNNTYTLSEIDVFSYGSSSPPTLATLGGELSAFDVQYWDGSNWITVPDGSVSGNFNAWKRFPLPPGITTDRIRVVVNYGFNGDYVRMMEVEAWAAGQTGNQKQSLAVAAPKCFELTGIFPNPFSGAARIQFGVPAQQKREMSLRIYDIEGRLVQTLVKGSLRPGYHSAALNSRGLVNGVYFCRMRAPGFEKSIKLLLCK